MLSWIFTFVGLLLSFIFMDLDSSSFIEALLCPLIFTTFLVILLFKYRKANNSQNYATSGISSFGANANSNANSSFDSWSVSSDSCSGDSSAGGE